MQLLPCQIRRIEIAKTRWCNSTCNQSYKMRYLLTQWVFPGPLSYGSWSQPMDNTYVDFDGSPLKDTHTAWLNIFRPISKETIGLLNCCSTLFFYTLKVLPRHCFWPPCVYLPHQTMCSSLSLFWSNLLSCSTWNSRHQLNWWPTGARGTCKNRLSEAPRRQSPTHARPSRVIVFFFGEKNGTYRFVVSFLRLLCRLAQGCIPFASHRCWLVVVLKGTKYFITVDPLSGCW